MSLESVLVIGCYIATLILLAGAFLIVAGILSSDFREFINEIVDDLPPPIPVLVLVLWLVAVVLKAFAIC